MFFLLLGAIAAIGKLQKQIELLDREQHQQNKDIMDLIKNSIQTSEMLLDHVDILKYLIDQDPILTSAKRTYGGPIGEA